MLWCISLHIVVSDMPSLWKQMRVIDSRKVLLCEKSLVALYRITDETRQH